MGAAQSAHEVLKYPAQYGPGNDISKGLLLYCTESQTRLQLGL